MPLLYLPLALVSLCVQLPIGPQGLTVVLPVRDLGRVRPGSKVTEAFLVVNGGTEALTILELRPECGCLTAWASRTRLAPGQAAEIRVTFEPPLDEEGAVTKTLEILTDLPGQPRTELVLKAEVRADIRLSANQVSFEGLPRDSMGRAEVRLEDRRGGVVRVTRLVSSAPGYLTAESVSQGHDVVLRIVLDGARVPRAWPQGEDWLEIQAANPELSEFRIQVRWSALPPPSTTH